MNMMDQLLKRRAVKAFVIAPHRAGQVRVACMIDHGKWLRSIGDNVDDCVLEIEHQISGDSGPVMPDLDYPSEELMTRMPGFD